MVIPPGFARVQVLLEIIGGHHCVSTWDYEIDTPLDQGDVDAASLAISSAWRGQLNSGSLFNGVKVLEGQDGDPLLWESTSGHGVGTQSGALCPPQTQGLIRKTTALAGRKHRGRVFIPDMMESQVGDLGDVNSTGLAKLDAIGSAHNFTASPWVILSILHTDNSTPTPVTGVPSQSKVATLRKRYER